MHMPMPTLIRNTGLDRGYSISINIPAYFIRKLEKIEVPKYLLKEYLDFINNLNMLWI